MSSGSGFCSTDEGDLTGAALASRKREGLPGRQDSVLVQHKPLCLHRLQVLSFPSLGHSHRSFWDRHLSHASLVRGLVGVSWAGMFQHVGQIVKRRMDTRCKIRRRKKCSKLERSYLVREAA